MKHIFLDTNVLYDFLFDRRPYSLLAAKIFSLQEEKKVKLYVSSASFLNLYFIIKKENGKQRALEILRRLSMQVEVLPMDEEVIKHALASSFSDFEDAVQHFSALRESRVKLIVTRDINDFKKSQLPVLTPDEFLSAV